jgi:hypothetical protein
MQKTITVGGRELTFSPLTIRGVRTFEETFNKLREGKLTGLAAVLAQIPIAHESLRKAHPDLTVEELEGLLTIDDIETVQAAFLEASGVVITKSKTVGEQEPVVQ